MAKFLDIDKMIDTALGLNDIGIGQLRSVEWGKKFLWDIKFTQPSDQPESRGLGKTFENFFPATDVEEGIANLESFGWEAFMNTYKVPRKMQQKEVRVTFYDDRDSTLLNWLDDWINKTIFNDGQFLTPLEQCLRLVQIKKLNSRKEVLSDNAYWVFPEGSIIYNGSSSSDPVLYSVQFNIVGVASKSGAGESNTIETLIRSFGSQVLRGQLGRFF